MSTKPATSECPSTPINLSSGQSPYLLLIRNATWYKGLPPEEIQRVLHRFTVWVEQLLDEGRIKVAHPLTQEGKIVAGRTLITDAPLAESKEAIAGYLIIQADSLQEAVEIAQDAPCLDYGQTLEVRAIATDESLRHAADLGDGAKTVDQAVKHYERLV